MKFDIKRWSQTDRIVGVGTLVLFISLFLPWFSVSALGFTFSVDGTYNGYAWIAGILCIVTLLYLVARALLEKLPVELPVAHEQLLTIVAGIDLLIIVIDFIDKPGGGGVGWSYGAFVGLIAAVVCVAPKLVPAVQSWSKSKMQKKAS